MEYEKQRRLMVADQIAAREVLDRRVLEAMGKVERHLFVPEGYERLAYADMALKLSHGQTISQPYMVGIMTEKLELRGSERVLEIGTGSGYQTAILCELAAEVYSIERICELTEYAQEKLSRIGYENYFLKCGDGTLGWPEQAPFDRILVTAGAPDIPQPLVKQLAEGGILVIPSGSRISQTLTIARKVKGALKITDSIPCVFVPLIGAHAWGEDNVL